MSLLTTQRPVAAPFLDDPTSAPQAPSPRLSVAVISEGTYPFERGGVSTWVDQVVRGLPEIDFHAVALIGSGNPQSKYPVPENLRSVITHELWGQRPQAHHIPVEVRERFLGAWQQIVSAAMAGEAPLSSETVQAWRELTSPEISERIWLLANDSAAVDILLTEYSRRHGPASVADAGLAAHFFSRTLVALNAPVPEVDIIHLTGNGSAVLPALVAKVRRGTPFVMSEHGVHLRERIMALRDTSWSSAQREMTMGLTRSLALLGYAEADLVLPVSQFNGRWGEQLGADEDRVQVLYNGVDLSIFPVGRPEPTEPVLSFVGRIDPLKDLITMVEALALVRQQIPGVRLRLFGPVPETNKAYLEQVQQRAAELGVTDALTFEGPISPANAGFEAGQVVVLSSISEGFPYSVIEALAVGRPVVGTDVGGVREAIGNGGLVVSPQDPEAFAQACIQLLTHPAERHMRAEIGRAEVEEKFTLDAMLERLHTTYRNSIDAPSQQRSASRNHKELS